MIAMEARLDEAVCPFCSLACDDLRLKRTERGGIALIGPECPLARTGYIEAGTDGEVPPRIAGQPVAESAAIQRAASHKPRLSSSRCARLIKRLFIAYARAQNLVSEFGAKPRVG